MQVNPSGYDPMIDGFFKALNQLQFTQAALILDQMRAQRADQPDYLLWANYLSGVLAQEQHRDWAKAERSFQQVLAANPAQELRADLYLSLGIAYENQARWTESIDVSNKGIAIWQALKRPIKQTMLLRQIAISCYRGFEAGDLGTDVLETARAKCEEALAILETDVSAAHQTDLYEIDGLRHRAITYQVLGCVHTCLGQYQHARESYQQFLSLSMLRQDDFHIACASWYLADVLQLSDQAEWEKTCLLYDDALIIFRQKQETFFQAHLWASKGSLYRRVKMSQQAIHCYQQSMQLFEMIRSQISSEEARSGFFSTIVNIHDNSVLAAVAVGDLAQAFDSAEHARSRVILDRLVGPIPAAPQAVNVTISVPALSSALWENDILVEFHCTGLRKPSHTYNTEQQAANNVLAPEPKTLIFVLTADSFRVFEANISPNMLVLGDTALSSGDIFSPPSIRRALYDKLIAPIAHLLQGKRCLYIIPHGPLHYIPFHALIAPDGDTLLREDGPEIVYAPSATILFRERQRPHSPASGSCLAVGYNGDEGLELHFAEEEAAYIARMAQGVALVGPSPKKAALYAQAPNYRALHFSCHGEFDPDVPLQSLLHIGPGETLTGQEIMDNLRLNCNLVTLSACESGLSKVQRGDELYGLIRAFMYAGTPAIIATLWQVDERSTLIFAEKFYALLQQGLPYAAALKAAQLYLRQLTRKEALLILSQHIAQHTSAGEISPLRQADQYLKSFASQPLLVADPLSNPLLHGEDDEALIFADPKFWAPFVLIGDPQIGRA